MQTRKNRERVWKSKHELWAKVCFYSLTEIETETEINIFSLSETERETEMFCKTEMKYKRKSEHIKRNSNLIEIDLTTKTVT